MLRAPVSAANSLLRSSDSAALPGNATVRRLSPCKNPPQSPQPTIHAPAVQYKTKKRKKGDADASLRWWWNVERFGGRFWVNGEESG